jgi:hypothetical protein
VLYSLTQQVGDEKFLPTALSLPASEVEEHRMRLRR